MDACMHSSFTSASVEQKLVINIPTTISIIRQTHDIEVGNNSTSFHIILQVHFISNNSSQSIDHNIFAILLGEEMFDQD